MRPRLLAVPVLVLALLLAGCGGDDEPEAGDGKAGGSPSSAPSGPATGLPEPTTPATPTASGPPTGRVQAVPGLPKGFPKNEVPLLDAKVVSGSRTELDGGLGWSVVLQPKGDDLQEIAAEAGERLEDAGFEPSTKTEQERLIARQYVKGDYQVGFTAVQTGDDDVLVTYLVSNATS